MRRMLSEVGLWPFRGRLVRELSGGMKRRLSIAVALTGDSQLVAVDEPTTGLHFHDVNLLLEVLKRLRDNGNTVAVIEHNMEVIKCSDWIIDLGPEGGAEGGEIIAQGTPEDLSKIKRSYTGNFLIDILKK